MEAIGREQRKGAELRVGEASVIYIYDVCT